MLKDISPKTCQIVFFDVFYELDAQRRSHDAEGHSKQKGNRDRQKVNGRNIGLQMFPKRITVQAGPHENTRARKLCAYSELIG